MKHFIIYSICICFIFVGTACQGQESKQSNNPEKVAYVNDSGADNRERLAPQEIAEHLAKLATEIPNVNEATAVVAGNYAVVGIDVDADLERSRVSTIKYTVAESLKKDPYGANAVIVADPDTFVRLQQMGKKIQSGEPVEGFMDELAEIIGRIMPEVPSDIDTQEDTEQQNKHQLPHEQEQNLEQIQKKQSTSKQERPQ